MEMVSSAKLSRAKLALLGTRAYILRIESVLKNLLASAEKVSHPFLEKRTETGRIVLCVITSDTGLCSVYNYAVIRAAEGFMNKFDKEKVRLIVVGKEGSNYFKKHGFRISNSYPDLRGRYSPEVGKDVFRDLAGAFLNREVDEAYIAYTLFTSTLHHKPIVERFLNVERGKPTNEVYISEPDIDTVLNELFSKYIFEKLRLILLNAFTSEHAARMVAMKAATDNADELLETLTLLRNKARQAMITKEVLEVALSAEALKG
jgi:F-type H+-transporting ATPase subunit gamma